MAPRQPEILFVVAAIIMVAQPDPVAVGLIPEAILANRGGRSVRPGGAVI